MKILVIVNQRESKIKRWQVCNRSNHEKWKKIYYKKASQLQTATSQGKNEATFIVFITTLCSTEYVVKDTEINIQNKK